MHSDALLDKLDAYIAANASTLNLIPAQTVIRSGNVRNIVVQDEILSSLPFSRIGLPPEYINNSHTGASSVDLHSQTLLAAFLQSGDTSTSTASDHTLGQVTYKLTDLLKMIFDSNLFAHPANKANATDPNFLELIVNHQAGFDPRTQAKMTSDEMVTRFTSDLWKLAQGDGLTMTDGDSADATVNNVSKALIAFAMQMYYEDTANAKDKTKQLFKDLSADILEGQAGDDELMSLDDNDIFFSDYPWCAIKLFNASFIRVCQPRPSDLKYANTSASKRIPVYTLGEAALGRPGLRLANILAATSAPTNPTNISDAGLKCFKSSNVISRTSPAALVNGLWGFISRYLSFVSTTQTNHSDTASNWRKTKHMQALIEIAQGDQSLFWVGVTTIDSNTRAFPIKIYHTIKRQFTFSQVFSRLSYIEINNHVNYCRYNNYICQPNALLLINGKWIAMSTNDGGWRVAA
jgi:hypothetical protein